MWERSRAVPAIRYLLRQGGLGGEANGGDDDDESREYHDSGYRV